MSEELRNLINLTEDEIKEKLSSLDPDELEPLEEICDKISEFADREMSCRGLR